MTDRKMKPVDGNQGVIPVGWDANRLVKEYVKAAWMTADMTGPFEQLPFPRQVRLKRLASVICAFLKKDFVEGETVTIINEVFDYIENRSVLASSPMTDENKVKLKQVLLECLRKDARYESLLSKWEGESDREQMLKVLLRFRIGVEDLKSMFVGVMEARTGGYLGINAVKDLYSNPLMYCNDKVDKMIVLLLGSKFEGTISEKDLIEKYNYPMTTDSELLDWEIDNF